MGHSRASKADSHARIVKLAADAFRARGVESISVAELMKRAGLTHGGFYRHFSSREALVAEAVELALREGGAAVDAVAAQPHATIGALVDAYLSVAHRDGVRSSCAVTALAADVARGGARARAAYTAQVHTYVRIIERLLGSRRRARRRGRALAALATLVGAVSMSRAVDDDRFSRQILAAAAADLDERLSATRPRRPFPRAPG